MPTPPAGRPATIGQRRGETGRVVGQRDRHPRVRAGDHRQLERDVGDRPAHRPLHRQLRPAQGGRPRRHPARGGAQADDVAEGGRVAQRAAHVAAVGQRHEARGEGGRRPARRATHREAVPVRVVRRPEDGVERVRPGRELRHVRLPDADGAGRLVPGHDQLVAQRHGVGVQRRAPRRPHAAGGVGVLVRDRQPVQRAHRVAGRQRGVRGVGGRPRALGVEGHHGVEVGVQSLDPVEVQVEQFARRDLPGADHPGELRRGPEAQVVGHAVSLPRPRLRAAGAFGER